LNLIVTRHNEALKTNLKPMEPLKGHGGGKQFGMGEKIYIYIFMYSLAKGWHSPEKR